MKRHRIIFIASAFLGAYSGMLVNFVLSWASSRYGPAVLGATLLAGTLPRLLLTLASGIVADKVDPRVSLALSAAFRAAVLVIVALGANLLNGPVFFIAGNFMLHLIGSLFASSAYIIAPSIFPKDELVRINAQTSLAGHAAGLLGPLSAGVLFVHIGLFPLLGLAAIFLLASGLILLLLPHINRTASSQTFDLQFIFAGFNYLLARKPIFAIAIFFAITNIFAASLQIALPYFAEETGGAITYSYLLTAANFGLAASALFLSFYRIKPSEMAIYATSALEGIALVGLGSTQRLKNAFLFLATNDMMAGINNNLFISYLQKEVDPSILGRVFSATTSLAQLLTPLGFIIAPAFLQELNPRIFLTLLGGGTLLISVFFYVLTKKLDIGTL